MARRPAHHLANYAKYPCRMADLLTPTERAESAFYARVAALGMTSHDELPMMAWENCFSVETHSEYRDDQHRWEIALATLNMLADERGIG